MKASARGVGALFVLALAATACRTGEAAEDGPKLETAEVTRGDLTISVEATGTVEPIRSVEVKSKASGEILKLHVDIGDKVKPGTLLAEVDPRDVRNRYDQAKADLEVARSRVDISKAQLERSDELLKSGVITQQEYDNARLDYANAQASLVKAKTNFELAQLQLGDVTIRAPMAGTILSKNVEEGQVIQSASQNVSGGTTLFVMANLDQMRVRTMVDETDMGQLRPGLGATVKVEAYPDRTFHGTVQKIEPQSVVQQNVTMFPVIVNLDNREGLLRPGMNAEVDILVDQARDVLLIPNNAVVQPSDVGPAALALGLDPDKLDLRALMREARGGRAGRGAAAGGGAAADGEAAGGTRRDPGARSGGGRPSASPGDGSATPGGAQGAGEQAARPGARAALDSLRAKVQRGEITQDSMRAVLRAFRARAGARGGAVAGARSGGADGQASGGEVPRRRFRPAVVFVMGPDSVPHPRAIQVGLNDWDNTQIAGGLEEGDRLVVVGAAQLQAQQQEWLNRIRSRMGGGMFGGGGPRGGGRR